MQQPNQAAPIGAYVPAQGESPIMIQTNQAAPPGASVPAEGAPTITLFEKLKNDSPTITLMGKDMKKSYLAGFVCFAFTLVIIIIILATSFVTVPEGWIYSY